jgi:hypothetical protein
MESYKHKVYQIPSSYGQEVEGLYNRVDQDSTKVLRMARRLEAQLKIFSTMDEGYALLYILSTMHDDSHTNVVYTTSYESAPQKAETDLNLRKSKLDEEGVLASASGRFKQQPNAVDVSQLPYVADHMKPSKPEDLSSYGPVKDSKVESSGLASLGIQNFAPKK